MYIFIYIFHLKKENSSLSNCNNEYVTQYANISCTVVCTCTLRCCIFFFFRVRNSTPFIHKFESWQKATWSHPRKTDWTNLPMDHPETQLEIFTIETYTLYIHCAEHWHAPHSLSKRVNVSMAMHPIQVLRHKCAFIRQQKQQKRVPVVLTHFYEQ